MTDTYVAVQERSPIVVLRERLEVRKGELRAALPSDIAPEEFIRALMTSVQINPSLLGIPFQSLWIECMRACRDELKPDGKEGVIVPYKNSCSWIPMKEGLIKRFRKSGQCKWITADVARAGEPFEHYVDEHGEHFKHVPDHEGTAPVTKVYAAAITKDGAFSVAIMSMPEIEKIRKMSRATRDDAPWKVWPEEMMKKSALRRLAKMLPSGRNIMPDDDDAILPNIINSPALAAVPRAAGAAAALDQFASSNPDAPPSGGPVTPLSTNPAEEMGDGGESETGAAHLVSDPAAVPPLTPHGEELVEAHGRGMDAKTQGFTRKAMPPEYRDDQHSRHAMAWQAGFDGKDMPEWSAS